MPSELDLSELQSHIGSLFMAGMPGPDLDGDTVRLIRDYGLGGIILFNRNIEDPVQLAHLCRELQEEAVEYQGTPLFLAVDQEGGPVARLREPFSVFPGNTALGDDPSPVEKAVEFARTTATEMGLVGLNMDLAPVVDVRRGPPERHLNGRTFGDDPRKVALLGNTVIRELQEKGIMAAAKHFPGLGRASLDPHVELPVIDSGYAEITEKDLPPFKEAVRAGVCAIMTAHGLYTGIDSERPATLSTKIITGLLREQLGFEGLVMTDDLEMGAIKKGWGVAEGACSAFLAGADILLICLDQSSVVESMRLMRSRILKGEIPAGRLMESRDRIARSKAAFLSTAKEISIAKVEEYFGHGRERAGRV